MIVLEIAIGLVFIYFLYSLLLSIMVEIISAWFGFRARTLRQGIGNLMNDHRIESINRDFLKWIKDIFLVEPAYFKYSTAGRFYQQPSVKYMAKVGENAWYSFRNTKPAYLSDKNFADTVLSMLSKKGMGNSAWDKVQFSIEKNALHLEPDTLLRFQKMLVESNGQYELFENELKEMFNQMMDRVNGWYKRKVRLILFWLGMVVAIGFNADTLQIINILSENKVARQQMVELAIATTDSTSQLNKALQGSNDTVHTQEMLKESYRVVTQATKDAKLVIGHGWDIPYDTEVVEDSFKVDFSDFYLVKDSIYPEILATQSNLRAIKVALSQNNLDIPLRQVLDSIKVMETTLQEQNASLISIIGATFFNIDTIRFLALESSSIVVKGQKSTPRNKAAFIWSEITKWQKLIGLLLTALALTLGAPFWFDLLKKLIAIRNSGINPDEKKKDPKKTMKSRIGKSNGSHPISPNPVDIVLSQNRKYWESLLGVIGVNRSIMKEKGIMQEGIEIIVQKGFDHDHIFNQIKDVKIEVIEGEIHPLHKNDEELPEHAIIQPSTGAWGTGTGIVINKYTGKDSLLCCGHVLRSDKSGYIKENKSEIKMKIPGKDEFQTIGHLSNLVLSNFLDAGVIDITKNGTEIIKKYRRLEISPVKPSEKIKVQIHTLKSGEPIEGTIIHSSKNFLFRDGDELFRMYSLIMIDPLEEEAAPEKEVQIAIAGDSGSLITDDHQKGIGLYIGSGVYNKKIRYFGISLQDIFDSLNVR